MKALLIFPPIWYLNVAPMLGIPAISGCLRHFGHETVAMDLNSDFMNAIFTKSFCGEFKTSYENIKERAIDLQKSYKNIEEITSPDEIAILKYYTDLSTIIDSSPDLYEDFLKGKDYLQLFKDDECFYNHLSLNEMQKSIKRMSVFLFNINKCSFNDEKLSPIDIFKNYYDSIINKIIDINPDYIGLSVYTDNQYYWSKYFARMLKKHLKAHISFGGGNITQRVKDLETDFDFFTNFADSAAYGDD